MTSPPASSNTRDREHQVDRRGLHLDARKSMYAKWLEAAKPCLDMSSDR
jgi:hypothetical protein